jgi:hypothetical protein
MRGATESTKMVVGVAVEMQAITRRVSNPECDEGEENSRDNKEKHYIVRISTSRHPGSN